MPFTEALTSTWEFLRGGGFFMVLLGLCSLAAVTVIVFKFITLNRARVLPEDLEKKVERFEEHLNNGEIEQLQKSFVKGENSLSRLCAIAVTNTGRTQGEVQETVQSSAREEIVQMSVGLAALEVITTIAPLLGLLGTASGLVTVFEDIDSKATLQRGIATALSTTVVGIAIAVPAVIAHSFFSRKIEIFAARLEVLLGRVISVSHQNSLNREQK